ncbi:Talin-2 [Fasciola gigantica]|uniref:Talin-2 n=1 Tax=Fasciola gigantica TaxID=46835 RepID=A0A504X7H3_FASGI|nr:Talin-2 [Fasciola gigantica]
MRLNEFNELHHTGKITFFLKKKIAQTILDFTNIDALTVSLPRSVGRRRLPPTSTYNFLVFIISLKLKEAIINGTHPISLEQAIRLAALQCQAEIGVLTAEKAKYNSIDLKEHLPKEYAKVKGVEKRIQERHKKLGDFDEKEAKLQYIQLCRSLPTYGITFFLIKYVLHIHPLKEKLKGRNKLVPRLFGVSKESVMRVDEKTKEILETWPLTRIRRWAARSNLFILDFGQYSPDGNYAVQTTEGEQIGQLISGYIDIILRRQRSKLGAAGDADEENTIVEDNVSPSRANVISNMAGTLPRGQRAQEANVAHTGILRTASYRGDFAEGHIITRDQAVTQQNLGGAQVGSGRIINRSGITNPNLDGNRHSGFQIIDLGQPKRALLQRIDFGLRSIQEATEELEKPVYSDDEALRGDDAVDAAQGSEQGAGLRAAAQSLSDAFLDLMHAAVPASPSMNDAGDKASTISRSSSSLVDARHGPDRAALLEAASRVGDASRQLLQHISQPSDRTAHQDPVVSTLMSVSTQLPATVGDGMALVGKASTLASASSRLMADLRAEASTKHSRTAKRQSTISGCSSPTDNASVSYSGFASAEQQAQATAEEMLRNLLSIGESCVSDAGQLIAWALQDEAVQPLSDDTSEAALLSEQICLDTSCQLTEKPNRPRPQHNSEGTKPSDSSEVVRLAHIADQITSALAEVIRAAGGRGGTQIETIGHLLDGLNRVGPPVAASLRYAMHTVNTNVAEIEYDQPIPDFPPEQAILQLRNWAVELSLQADNKAASNSEKNTDRTSWDVTLPDTNMTEAMAQMRGQCEAAVRRVATLIQPATVSSESVNTHGTGSPPPSAFNYCAIRLPVNNDTYSDCLEHVTNIDQEMKTFTDAIPQAAVKRDAQKFTDAVKAVAQATCYLLQVTNQAAYLISASHPASKPGHASLLAKSDQLTSLHDHIAAVRKGVSELGCTAPSFATDGLLSLEIMNISNNVVQHATQLCQSTRPLLAECKNSSEKKAMAESLERVARAASSVSNIVHSVKSAPASESAATFSHLKTKVNQLEEAVDQYADILLRAAGGSPSQVAEEALVESTRCAVSLSQASEQTALLSLTRTILEAEQQVIDHLVQCVEDKNVHTLKSRPSDPTARDYVNQLKQACQELLARVNAIAKQQGGLNWHISSINSACSKLDYITAVSSANSSNDSTGATYSLPSSFVQLHTRLGHQSRALSEAAGRLAEVSTGNWTVASADDDSEVAITQATAAVAHAFTQMAETVQSISGVLSKQTQAETGLILARRLCQITQAVGAACADFLRAPVHPEQLNKLTSRLVDLKSALQSCARGADACAAAATGIGRLVAELDTAVLFARTDALVDPAGSPSSLSPTLSPMNKAMLTSKQRAFQSAQEAAMQAAKGIVEDMRALIKNTATDQDALAVSAQNCLLRATDLTSAVKCAATRASSGMPNNESCIESQVLLLTAAHEVTAGLVDLLQQGKAVAATCYALEAWGGDSSGVGEQSAENKHESLRSVLNSRQKALNETAVRVVETISGLSRALRGLSDVVQFNKTVPASPCSSTPPSVPPKRISLTSPSTGKLVSSTTNGHAKNSVHANLESTLGALKQLEKRLTAWSIDNGTLKIPAADCDWESEEQHALGHVTKPSQLISAAQAITQMAIKANTATGSGELSDIAQSADHLRRAAEELIRRLRAACQYALEQAHQNHSPGAGGPNGVMGVESVNGEDELEHSIANVERACRRAISGTVDTMSELKQMVEHMNTSLETGASSPASVQVTLAMRRLRETVYEIVDSANSFPEAKDDTNEQKVVLPKSDPVVFRNSSQSSTASDGTAPPLMPKPSATRLRQSVLFPNPQTRAEIEQSIAAANATAKDAVGSHVLQNALHDVAGEIERNVHRIGQLKTHHVFKSPTAPQNTSESALVKVKGGGDQLSSQESLDAVLSACQLVVHTTLGLMYWAAAAQRELVQQGRLRPVDLDTMTGHEAESQWAQGLISAVIETKSSIAAKQKELDRLHKQLKHINQDQYRQDTN